ncbi:hypothetical protein HER10_EVM0006427 [Colletotrichum scovillei]|uniref:uncharacterized protein n=1 Tax=Colletotrichum scovillei TaxID=1209932 RepID=UPI0015C2CC26|nr:uncharacterized protein HER10_EVM0006427 [Colletotrichum scovillei]KAF4772797.1 hypothetical protein HER10_EVM0006427 [Colletotrichum scovillei]
MFKVKTRGISENVIKSENVVENEVTCESIPGLIAAVSHEYTLVGDVLKNQCVANVSPESCSCTIVATGPGPKRRGQYIDHFISEVTYTENDVVDVTSLQSFRGILMHKVEGTKVHVRVVLGLGLREAFTTVAAAVVVVGDVGLLVAAEGSVLSNSSLWKAFLSLFRIAAWPEPSCASRLVRSAVVQILDRPLDQRAQEDTLQLGGQAGVVASDTRFGLDVLVARLLISHNRLRGPKFVELELGVAVPDGCLLDGAFLDVPR